MQVIGVAAQLANGKDVLCDYLVQKLNEKNSGWQRGAFANAVKETFEDAFGVSRQFIEDWKRNPEPPPGFKKNIRQSLQFIGDGFRQIKDGIWIEIALRDERKKLIISDSRYINEAKAVKEKGGVMVVLYRPGFLNDDPNPSESQIKPVVEWCANNLKEGPILYDELKRVEPTTLVAVPETIQFYDYFLINEGSLQDLYDKVDRLLVPYIEEKYGQ